MGESRSSGRPASAWRLLYQVLFAGFVLALGLFAGGEGFTFFAGGLVVGLVSSLAFNLRAWLFLDALAKPGAAEGAVKLSSRLAVQDQAFQFFGLAVACLCMGLLLAHLALLGASLFHFAAAVGYSRRASALDQPTSIVEAELAQ